MKFLYSDNGRGIFSSLTGSIIFWVIVILLVILIVLLVFKSNKSLDGKLRLGEIFKKPNHIDAMRESVINEINHENSLIKMDNEDENDIPQYEKILDENLDEELAKNAPLLGNPDDENHIKSFYAISSKKNNVFKIADDTLDAVNFKLELNNLTKISMGESDVSVMMIYNQNYKCIAKFDLEKQKIKIQSSSPLFDNIDIDLESDTRLLVFTQISNKLMVDKKHIATFNIYDKITYFHIKSPIIKEVQYL